jgi:hypothetical protein
MEHTSTNQTALVGRILKVSTSNYLGHYEHLMNRIYKPPKDFLIGYNDGNNLFFLVVQLNNYL